MTISRSTFDLLRDKWGRYSSWAVWAELSATGSPKERVGDLSVLDPDVNVGLLKVLKSDVVMIGLNASSRDVSGEPWFGFHDPSPRANDFKLRHTFRDTPYWGAYMTDVFNDLHETKSNLVASYLRGNPAEVERQIDRLRSELADLGSQDPLLIVFGNQAFEYVQRYFGNDYRAVKVPHFSNYVGKDRYRGQVLAAITEYLEAAI